MSECGSRVTESRPPTRWGYLSTTPTIRSLLAHHATGATVWPVWYRYQSAGDALYWCLGCLTVFGVTSHFFPRHRWAPIGTSSDKFSDKLSSTTLTSNSKLPLCWPSVHDVTSLSLAMTYPRCKASVRRGRATWEGGACERLGLHKVLDIFSDNNFASVFFFLMGAPSVMRLVSA